MKPAAYTAITAVVPSAMRLLFLLESLGVTPVNLRRRTRVGHQGMGQTQRTQRTQRNPSASSASSALAPRSYGRTIVPSCVSVRGVTVTLVISFRASPEPVGGSTATMYVRFGLFGCVAQNALCVTYENLKLPSALVFAVDNTDHVFSGSFARPR